VCEHATGKYVLNPAYDPVDFTGGISATLLNSQTCTPVSDISPFTVKYTSADPSIAELVYAPVNDPACSTCPMRGAVTLVRPGDTTGTVQVLDKVTGKVVASATFKVHSTAQAIAEANMHG
jgi:hypothetical protein